MGLCATIYALICGHPTPPLPRVFEALAIEPATLGTNDCSNKAGRYARALIAAGIEAHVVYVRPPDPDAQLHAVVLAGSLVCDPTSGKVSRDLADFGTFAFVINRDRLMRDQELA